MEATLDQKTIEELSLKLQAELAKSLDKREVDLCTKLGNELDAKLKAAREEDERQRAKFNLPGVGREETRKFSIAKLVKGVISRNYSECGFELELCNADPRMKDMAAGTDSAGGFIVPNIVLSNEMIPLLKEHTIAAALGVNFMTGLRNSPVQIPKKTGATTAYWVGEAPSSGVTTSDVAFGQIEVTPHTVAVRTRVSNRLIMLSNPAVEQIIRQDILEQIGLAVDAACFNGSGAANQPKGILNTTGIGSVTSFGAASASTTYNKLLDMLYQLRKSHVFGPLAWAMHPAVLREFQKMLDDTAQPKVRRLFDSQPITQTLHGYPFFTSDQIPTNDVILGWWQMATVAVWDSMSIMVSNVAGTAFENLQTQILGAMDVDVAVRQAGAFCNTTGMTGATA